MKYIIIIITLLLLLPKAVSAEDTVISTDSHLAHRLLTVKPDTAILETHKNVSVIKVDEITLRRLAIFAKEEGRCAGYFVHDSVSEAKAFIKKPIVKKAKRDYPINQSLVVGELIKKVKEETILNSIKELTSFHNRYYTSETGVLASVHIQYKIDGVNMHRLNSLYTKVTHKLASWLQLLVLDIQMKLLSLVDILTRSAASLEERKQELQEQMITPQELQQLRKCSGSFLPSDINQHGQLSSLGMLLKR